MTATATDYDPFADADFVDRYIEGPKKFVPGHDDMRRMVTQLLAEDADENARILVLGAGGGLELRHFAETQPGWSFVGVDPAAQMLDLARSVMGDQVGRCQFVEGTIADAPTGPFDGASCLLTLHMIPDDGAKLATLTGIRERLRPGAPFVVVDNCLDRSAADFALRFERNLRFARAAGASAEDIDLTRQRLPVISHVIGRAREEALLAEAGFRKIDLFYAGFTWTGWSARDGE